MKQVRGTEETLKIQRFILQTLDIRLHIFGIILQSTVKLLPIGNHLKAKELVVAYGRWSPMRVELQKVFFKES